MVVSIDCDSRIQMHNCNGEDGMSTSTWMMMVTDRRGNKLSNDRVWAQAYAPNCVGIFIFLSQIDLIVISFSLRVLVIFLSSLLPRLHSSRWMMHLNGYYGTMEKQNSKIIWFDLRSMPKLWLCLAVCFTFLARSDFILNGYKKWILSLQTRRERARERGACTPNWIFNFWLHMLAVAFIAVPEIFWLDADQWTRRQ